MEKYTFYECPKYDYVISEKNLRLIANYINNNWYPKRSYECSDTERKVNDLTILFFYVYYQQCNDSYGLLKSDRTLANDSKATNYLSKYQKFEIAKSSIAHFFNRIEEIYLKAKRYVNTVFPFYVSTFNECRSTFWFLLNSGYVYDYTISVDPSYFHTYVHYVCITSDVKVVNILFNPSPVFFPNQSPNPFLNAKGQIFYIYVIKNTWKTMTIKYDKDTTITFPEYNKTNCPICEIIEIEYKTLPKNIRDINTLDFFVYSKITNNIVTSNAAKNHFNIDFSKIELVNELPKTLSNNDINKARLITLSLIDSDIKISNDNFQIINDKNISIFIDSNNNYFISVYDRFENESLINNKTTLNDKGVLNSCYREFNILNTLKNKQINNLFIYSFGHYLVSLILKLEEINIKTDYIYAEGCILPCNFDIYKINTISNILIVNILQDYVVNNKIKFRTDLYSHKVNKLYNVNYEDFKTNYDLYLIHSIYSYYYYLK